MDVKRTILQGVGFGPKCSKKIFRSNESTPDVRRGTRLRKDQDGTALGDSDGLGLMDQMQEDTADSLIQPS